jgi:hypothetical protein
VIRIFFFSRCRKIPVDINIGCTDEIADDVAKFLGFEGDLRKQCAQQVGWVFAARMTATLGIMR